MKLTDIYQTLEDRHNDHEIKQNGPFLCSEKDSKGVLKVGIKEPWLGEGYYFWDSRVDDAHWWGKTVYLNNGYVICCTRYDQHSELLYDLVGDQKALDDFIQSAKVLIKSIKGKITVPTLLGYLKKQEGFNYKAIRVWPYKIDTSKGIKIEIIFPGEKMGLIKMNKIQVCFFDKTLLTEEYKIFCKSKAYKEQTI